MSENAVEIRKVYMRFNLSKEKIDSLKEFFIKFIKRQLMFDEFIALNDITFDIKKGEIFGIVGLNGSGKSTLLKIISSIYKPSLGTVKVEGSIAPLIELGTGFDMDLTARENIFLNGTILGHTTKNIQNKFDEIVDFSELFEFLDVPLKNFSSGMVARLGFAMATITKPDILIVDEILSVGDFLFQKKCEERISNLMRDGTTVIIVSHSITQIERLCNRVMWLEKGKIRMIGPAEQVCNAYKITASTF